jgi:hypothetical protein
VPPPIHLEETVTGVQITLHHEQVMRGTGINLGDSEGIELDGDFTIQSGKVDYRIGGLGVGEDRQGEQGENQKDKGDFSEHTFSRFRYSLVMIMERLQDAINCHIIQDRDQQEVSYAFAFSGDESVYGSSRYVVGGS